MVYHRRRIKNRVQSLLDEVLHILQREAGGGDHSVRPATVQAARLEERILMSASPVAMVVDTATGLSDMAAAQTDSEADDSAFSSALNLGFDTTFHAAIVAAECDETLRWDDVLTNCFHDEQASAQPLAEDPAASFSGNSDTLRGPELVVIDFRVRDADTLLASLLSEDRDIRLLRLDADEDGLQQITTRLEQIGNVSAIHLLTHGRDGEILLGSTRLNTATLAQHTPELLAWQHTLTADADILLYGCDVAHTVEGQDFVESLRRLTGADIAASTNTTGSEAFGGDWVLEYTAGTVDIPGLFSVNVMDTWQHRLVAGQSITVTTTNDVVDGNVSSVASLLADSGTDGQISLREALLAANTNADIDEIILGPGEYTILITGRDNVGAKGDFDILQDVIIRGAGSSSTIIHGNSIDRVFDVRETAQLTISGVTVTGGDTRNDGGGFSVERTASLVISESLVAGNAAERKGGGIANSGTVTLTNVTLKDNTTGSDGGGLYNDGIATVVQVTSANNMATRGAGVFHSGGDNAMSLVNVTLSSNAASNAGGGLFAVNGASLTNVTVASNRAANSGAGIKTVGASVTLQNTLLASNVLNGGTASNVSGTVLSLGSNLDSDGTAALNQAGDISGVDADLQSLAANGGFTLTHALKSTSVAIDAGTGSGSPATDQRGVARDGAVDIGAYEFDRAFLRTGQFQVNTTLSSGQVTSAETRGSQQAIARDHAGNYIVTWSSNGQDGSGWGIYAQRFDAWGNPLGSEIQVNTTTSDNQQWARIAADSSGNFVITWTSSNQDGTTQSVYARRYSSAGVALSGEFRVNVTNTGVQKNSTIAMTPDGKFVIAWQGEGPGDTSGIFFRRFRANGTAFDNVDRLANAASSDPQINANVGIDGQGNFVIQWQDANKLYFQRFGSNGTALGSRTQIDNSLATSTSAALAMNSSGSFVVAYREESFLPGIWTRGFNPDGTENFTWFQADSGSSSSPSVAMTDDGQFILAWQGTIAGDNDGTAIVARRYFANGAANGSKFLVNEYTAGGQNLPSLTMLDPENFVVVWSGETASDSSGVVARQYGTATSRGLQAQSDYATTPTNTAVSVDVLSNDSRPNNGSAIRMDVTAPTHGAATIQADGQISYMPAPGYTGPDSFTYLISDGTDGTTHYWSLGGTAVDSFGGANGTLHGTTTVAGSYGTALSFNESTDYVEIPDFEYTPAFSVSFDFRIDDNTGTDYQYLYSHGSVDAVNSLNIFLGEAGRPGFENVLKTTFGDSNDSYDVNSLNTNIGSLIGDGQWHSYALTVDKTFGSRVYIDGVLRATASGRGGDIFNPAGSLFLGTRDNLDPARFFGGDLDSVRIFNRALTAAEVTRVDNGLSALTTSMQSSATVYVTVQNAEPVTSINGPYSGTAGLAVTFSAAGTTDANNDAIVYDWDLNYDGINFNTDVSGLSVTQTWAQLQASGVSIGTNTIALRATDSRGGETIETTTLQIAANAAPADIVLSTVIIPGERPGAVVGTLTTTDSTVDDQHSYTVTDSRFEVVSGQLKLKAGQSIVRATEPSLSLTITSTDLAGGWVSRTFLLTTANGPVVARDNSASTNENTAITVIAPGVLANDDRPSGSVTPGAVLNFDAAEDTNGDSIWQDSTSVVGHDFTLGTGVARNAVTSTNHYGILSSWHFDGTASSGAVSSQSLAALPGDPTDGAATFELWFRPEDLTKKHILIDSGSASPGAGLSVRLNGTQLEYCVYTNGTGPAVTSNISSQLGLGDYVQFLGTVRLSGGVATIEMYVNGVLVGSDSQSGISRWSDALENLAIGRIDGSVNVLAEAGSSSFTGEIAQFRFYDTALSQAQALANFNAVAGTQAGLTVSATDTTSTGTRGSVSISSGGAVTYNPNGQFDSLAAGATATDSFRYSITDGTNSASAQVTVTITGVNDAPVMAAATPSLGSVAANAVSSAVSVGSMIGTTVTDADDSALRGIAVTATSGAGAWQFSSNGSTWTDIGSVSTTQALLLRATDQIRFSGTGSAAGTATLTYAAWDQTVGTAGATFNLSTSGQGGSTAFSTRINTASLTLQRINFAPSGVADTYELNEDSSLTTTTASGWFNSQWNTRQKIAFNNSSGSVLTNQVVRVALNASTIDYLKTQNAGQDLRFVDSDGTLLNYEIETWNESGTSVVWVQVPQIDGNSNTDFIWMYYGNSQAVAGQNSGGVWAAQTAVLHMDGTVTDSSPNSLSITDSGTTAGVGISSGARSFDGVDDFVQIGPSSEVDDLFRNGGTISVWINPAGWGENGFGRIADKATTTFGSTDGPGWALQVTSSGNLLFEHGFSTSHGEWTTANSVLTLNTWAHVAVVYDASSLSNTPRIYVNGVQVSVVRNRAPGGSFVTDSSVNLTVGNFAGATTRTFNGRIDEFRISKTTTTLAQIQADYRTMSGALTTIGAAEPGPGGVLSNDTDSEQDPLTVSLAVGPQHSQSFVLNSNGTFTYVAAENFSGIDTFTYYVTDGTLTSGPVTVTLNVRPVNDAPTGIVLSSTSLTGYTNAAVVGTVTAVDPDAGDSHTFTVSDARFEIVAEQLKLKAGQSIDPIAEPSVTLQIRATDAAGTFVNQSFTLTTANPNNPPTLLITPVRTSVQENTSIATPLHVATISIIDDTFGTNTLSLRGPDAARFQLIGNELYLRAGTLLDYESKAALQVTVRVDDATVGTTPDDSKTFVLSVIDVNEMPSLLLTPVISTVAENSPTTTAIRVAELTITDDALGTNVISLHGADADKFEVIDAGLFLKAGTILDYEVASQLDVTVRLDDTTVGETPDATADFSLQILNVNEAPVAIANGPYTISEGQGLTLNAAGSSDPDGDALTYEWDLNGNGVYLNAGGSRVTLNWEELQALPVPINDSGTRTIRLRVTDTNGLANVVQTTLRVLNTAPVITVSGAASVDSGAPYVLSFSATDPGHDTITSWSINWGDGTTQTVAGSLNSATHVYASPGGTRSITVSGTDEDGTYAMTDGPLVISIHNHAPENIVVSDRRVTAGIAGAAIGSVSFSDVDSGDSHVLTVDDSRFEIAEGVLRLRAGQSLNPNSPSVLNVILTVTDSAGASTMKTLEVLVNKKANGTDDSYAVDGTRQLSVASPSAGVLANDEDPDGDTLTAILATGPLHAQAFGLNADGTFWYRAVTGYSGLDTFTYFVNDGQASSGPMTVTLTVNQPPSISFLQIVASVPENTLLTERLLIGTFVITDDGIGTNAVRLTGSDASFFELDGSNRLYMKSGTVLDYESRSLLSVTATVDDPAVGGRPDDQTAVTLQIQNLNEGPTTSGLSNVTVHEDAGLQWLSTSQGFSDPDGDELEYRVRVVSQTNGLLEIVSIDKRNGTLRYRSSADAFGQALVEVTATDTGGVSVSTQFTITVLPVNDAPILRSFTAMTYVDQPLIRSTAGLLSGAFDPDSASISVLLIQGPANGTITLNPDGTFVYQPTADFSGTDSFTFAGTDGTDVGIAVQATIQVQPLFIGPGTSTSSASASTSGSGSSTTSSTSTSDSRTRSGSGTTAASGNAANNGSALQVSASNNDSNLGNDQSLMDPVLMTNALNPDVTSENEIFAMMPQLAGGMASATSLNAEGGGSGEEGSTERESSRRSILAENAARSRDSLTSSWDTRRSLSPLELQRQQVYQELAVQAAEQFNFFEEKLTRNVRMEGRVVGSVGVVTTGFSVGYLIWAVRGGMLLSGVLSQIPAWTMLDPLMVIDGDGRDDDKESLQTIVDRQQAKLNTDSIPPELAEPVDD